MGEEVEKLVERLKEPLTPDGYERLMKGWDAIRQACGESEGSLPRDMFESLIDGLLQDMEEAAATLERLAKSRDAAQREADRFAAEADAAEAQVEALRKARGQIESEAEALRATVPKSTWDHGKAAGLFQALEWIDAALSVPAEETKGDTASRDHAPTHRSSLEGLADYLLDEATGHEHAAKQLVGGQSKRHVAEAKQLRAWAAALASSTPERERRAAALSDLAALDADLICRPESVTPESVSGCALERPAGPCEMGVGCDEVGVCYAAAQDEPDRCMVRAPAEESGAYPEWRPIETAPRDVAALLYAPPEKLYDDPNEWGWAGEILVSRPQNFTWATHWLPLPTPPKA